MINMIVLLLGAKKDAWFTIYCSMRLYAVILILNCFADYNCCKKCIFSVLPEIFLYYFNFIINHLIENLHHFIR